MLIGADSSGRWAWWGGSSSSNSSRCISSIRIGIEIWIGNDRSCRWVVGRRDTVVDVDHRGHLRVPENVQSERRNLEEWIHLIVWARERENVKKDCCSVVFIFLLVYFFFFGIQLLFSFSFSSLSRLSEEIKIFTDTNTNTNKQLPQRCDMVVRANVEKKRKKAVDQQTNNFSLFTPGCSSTDNKKKNNNDNDQDLSSRSKCEYLALRSISLIG